MGTREHEGTCTSLPGHRAGGRGEHGRRQDLSSMTSIVHAWLLSQQGIHTHTHTECSGALRRMGLPHVYLESAAKGTKHYVKQSVCEAPTRVKAHVRILSFPGGWERAWTDRKLGTAQLGSKPGSLRTSCVSFSKWFDLSVPQLHF